jgi:lipoic acid synthetase
MKRVAKPSWLKRKLPTGPEYEQVRALLASSGLSTVCQEAKCPNMWECFSKKTSTFMILGSECTRNCRFCNVTPGAPDLPDSTEPERVAEASKILGLRYVVVTSVTRDDLKDGGSAHFATTIEAIRKKVEGVKIEVLIPDFQGRREDLETVLAAKPDVLNHNIETVPSLYSTARPQAKYQQSLDLLKRASKIAPDIPTKSGIMVGLGETNEKLIQTMNDLCSHGCRILTLGQYLQPSSSHLPVERYYTPEEFEKLKETALEMGFENVAAGPFVRSSYRAEELSCHC